MGQFSKNFDGFESWLKKVQNRCFKEIFHIIICLLDIPKYV